MSAPIRTICRSPTAPRALDLHTLDDPRLRTLRIGVHAIGDDGSNVLPAHALGAYARLEDVLSKRGAELQAVLTRYGVPLVSVDKNSAPPEL